MAITAIWLPPSQCGCEIQLTADWANSDEIINGKTSRHPIPFTIQDVQIIACCPRHQATASAGMPDIEHLFEIDPITGQKYQHRGYLKLPMASPSPAHVLYHYLCGHKGQTHSFPCGCRAHMWGDFSGRYTHIVKPDVTRKCLKHKNDTIDMKQAQADFDAQIAASADLAQSTS